MSTDADAVGVTPADLGTSDGDQGFFASRWVDRPAHVRELPAVRMAGGFRAAGVACGLKASGDLDLGVILNDGPTPVSAVRFTRSGVIAAPVQVTRERCDLAGLRAVVVNSGNANAATGRQGLDEAARTQGAGAVALGVDETHVALASTGVIGVPLDGGKIVRGLIGARGTLAEDGFDAFSRAIRTTDLFPKHAALEVTLPSGTVTITAQAKGAGMISPNFATMLCFVQTDAELTAETADLLLGVCVKRSFDRISVDGQLSTNDTAILMASGASGVKVGSGSPDELALGEALDALMRQLALMMAHDGEGADRVGRVLVTAPDPAMAEHVARAIANSPLVKAALNGGDPNWGRIAQAVGGALVDLAPVPVDIWIENTRVCAGGTALRHDAAELAAAVQRTEVQYAVGLGGEAEAEVFFSDLSHGYVTVNAEYTT